MKVIIDSYRGGSDTGSNINGKYEKNLLLELGNYMSEELTKKGIKNELVRENDVSLTDDERSSIINEIKDNDDIVIQNRYKNSGDIEIVYPLRSSDELVSLISNKLEKDGFKVEKYYQRRLPSNPVLDYYNVIRSTKPNESIIIIYNDLVNYQDTVKLIVDAISEYIKNDNTYKVVSGDSLYKIAKKYGVTVDDIKKVNKLNSNLLSIGQILIIPTKKEALAGEYIVKKGDSLYSIARKYGISVNELKKLNNLNSNILNIDQVLKVPEVMDEYFLYSVKKGDSLYAIARTNNTTVDEIKKINNLSNNLLSIGQVLKIPR